MQRQLKRAINFNVCLVNVCQICITILFFFGKYGVISQSEICFYGAICALDEVLEVFITCQIMCPLNSFFIYFTLTTSCLCESE